MTLRVGGALRLVGRFEEDVTPVSFDPLPAGGAHGTVAGKGAPAQTPRGMRRAALALVALGEAPYGIVYATDAVAEGDVTVTGSFPAEAHPPVVYPAAALAESDNPLNQTFLDFLRGPEAREAFERQGFVVVAE